jgi:hypothetical protein
VTLIWKSKGITLDVEKTSEQDTIAITQAQDGKRDTGLAEHGQQNQFQKWCNMNPFTLSKGKIIEMVNEYSFNGKYEGDMVRVGSFRRRDLPNAIMTNVLKAITNTTGQRATSVKYKKGAYDDVEIRLFGQLLTYLSGRW